MTSSIFSGWLTEINQKMVIEKRKILLFVDNATPHRISQEFSNLQVVFMPPNCTSVLQPLDQGVIWSFKCIYRRMLLDFIIDVIDQRPKEYLIKNFHILTAMHVIRCAWLEVTPNVVINGFKKAGFLPKTNMN